MRISMKALLLFSSLTFIVAVFLFCYQAAAQTSSNSGTIQGVVTDPTGAVIAGAKVEIHNPVSSYSRSVSTDGTGRFSLPNVPFNPYHLTVTERDLGSSRRMSMFVRWSPSTSTSA
jgi:hypothetical protein